MIRIRQEQEKDFAAIHQLNLAAFENGPEAKLVDKLRRDCDNYVAFVALDGDTVVGHIVFTPVVLESSQSSGMGLAPMAVLPSHQGDGIGSRLVTHGIKTLKESGCGFVIVLGHPEYYPRFGFALASNYNLRSQWQGVPDEAFMALVLSDGALPEKGGVARYHELFDEAI